MTSKELKEKTVVELQVLAAEQGEQIRALETGVRSATFKQTHEVAALKKSRARILTLLSQRSRV